MRLIWLASLVALVVAWAPGGAIDDDAEIRAEIEGYRSAWNAGDADGLASYYFEDGDRSNNRGDVFRGRAAIRDHYRTV
ncbi:MAG TPA: SgcJ/EcaC family oxidoreductase, partial [Dehalococcoidia bacterium]|nr:SgcJ/EcaC family oxidoreductase [Dehalococcoidia bacterium]